MILGGLKSKEKKIEYYIKMISESLLLVMQIHMLVFMDGGIINGTPNNVSLNNQLWFI